MRSPDKDTPQEPALKSDRDKAVQPGAKLALVFNHVPLGAFELKAAHTTIGRRAHCDIVIDHPAISGVHAAISALGNVHTIEDLGSTNGTIINGKRVTKQTLQNLDVVELGLHKLYYFNQTASSEARKQWEKSLGASIADMTPPPRPAANDLNDKSPEVTLGLAHSPKPVVVDDGTKGLLVANGKTAPESVASTYALRYMSGPRSGEIVPLAKGSQALGEPGKQSVAVIWRANGYFLTHLMGKNVALVNGRALGPGATRLADYDFIDIGGAVIEFIPRPAK